MSNYQESEVPGAQWQRCRGITINFPYGEDAVAYFQEEQVIVSGSATHRVDLGACEVVIGSDEIIPIVDLATGIATGETMTHAQLAAALSSLYLHTAAVRDGTANTTRSLEQAKLDKDAEINRARLNANRGTFNHEGKTFSCDELSRSDIDGVNGIVSLTSTLPPGWVGAWKAVDNTYLPIATPAEWVAFYGAMVAKGTENFTHAQALKTLVAAATTVEEVDAIQWGMAIPQA